MLECRPCKILSWWDFFIVPAEKAQDVRWEEVPHERTLTGRGSRVYPNVGAAGCTLKVGAAGCTLTSGQPGVP